MLSNDTWLARLLGRARNLEHTRLSTDVAPGSSSARVHWLDVTPQERDEQACSISRLSVDVQVHGLFAQVEQTMVIHNPNSRSISVPLTIALPANAVVCGYALDIQGMMVDAVVVEQERARVAFETEQRRGVDPGLVEAVRGNVYRTRVYPVPAGGARTVRLRSVAPLLLADDGTATLELPVPAEPVEEWNLVAQVRMLDAPAPVLRGAGEALFTESQGCWRVSAHKRDFAPTERVLIAMPELPDAFAVLERDDEGSTWFCASALEKSGESDEDAQDECEGLSLVVLWDASGSRAGLELASEAELLGAYASDPRVKQMTFVPFGNEVREPFVCTDAGELVNFVQNTYYDGGTNLPALAQWVKQREDADAGHDARDAGSVVADKPDATLYLLFTDGLDTLADEPFLLPASCDVTAIVSGQQRDAEAVRQACGGIAFDVATAPRNLEELLRARERARSSRFVALDAAGVADVCDVSSPTAGRRAVIGRLCEDDAHVTLGTHSFRLRTQDAQPGDTLVRAWAAKRVALLSTRAADNASELLDLGRRFGVVSPATSLLVLESLDQWLRHDIEPPRSWKSMHDAWMQAHKGRMQLDGGGDVARHRADLARAWKQTMEWWKGNYEPLVRPVVAGRPARMSAAQFDDMPMPAQPMRRAPDAAVRPEASAPSAAAPRAAARPGLFARASRASLSAGSTGAMPLDMLAQAAPAPVGEFGAGAELAMPDASVSSDDAPSASDATRPRVQVRAWTPDAPYLAAMNAAYGSAGDGQKTRSVSQDAVREAYMRERASYATSPAFFLDCAGWFMDHDMVDDGVRVLTNLAEMRIEDAALLRVLGWRLREGGRLRDALVILRRVVRLRGEDALSHRDVAQVLAELAREAMARGSKAEACDYAEQAGKSYRKLALTPWGRRRIAMSLFGVEEYNVLRAWAQEQAWDEVPNLPSLGDDLDGVPDCDLRITLAWDADETDVDLHVTEPSGEEAYYGHRLTTAGGRVSEDITDGYGPEQYEVRCAQPGTYAIRAHYYASHQQAVFGPATCTITVYTDWGRASSRQQVTSMRLDKEKQMLDVGTAAYHAKEATRTAVGAQVHSLRSSMSANDVLAVMGEPVERTQGSEDEQWTWTLSGGRALVATFANDKLVHVRESMPWGEQMSVF